MKVMNLNFWCQGTAGILKFRSGNLTTLQQNQHLPNSNTDHEAAISTDRILKPTGKANSGDF